jgi:hypothetical protein
MGGAAPAAEPQAFSEPLSRTDALYFTITVFSTVGFGDIVPVTDGARVATMVQMVGDLLVVGLVLRVMLGAVKAGRGNGAQPPPRGSPVPPITAIPGRRALANVPLTAREPSRHSGGSGRGLLADILDGSGRTGRVGEGRMQPERDRPWRPR